MSVKGTVASVNVSTAKGTPKQAVERIDVERVGIKGDAHAGPWHRQVSLLASEDVEVFGRQMQRVIAPGEFAENLTTRGIDLSRVAILDRFRIGDVQLEVTQIGKACHGDGCAIFREVGKCVMPKQGIFARVIDPGAIVAGADIELFERPLRILVLTLSDRAYTGVYKDRSGPKAMDVLQSHFEDKRWHLEMDKEVLSDDAEALKGRLTTAAKQGLDVIFTLGGTGLGPRDNAPEIVAGVCDKTFSGVMDVVRAKHGHDIPSAQLSRSIAGIAGTTLFYALPGSVRAVEQYLAEILRTLEHAIGMVHNMDWH